MTQITDEIKKQIYDAAVKYADEEENFWSINNDAFTAGANFALSLASRGWVSEKNVACLLKVGDLVKVQDIYGNPLKGKKGRITKIEPRVNCESGFMVSTDFSESKLDANWFIVLEPSPNQSIQSQEK
jgi:hypothetical protein